MNVATTLAFSNFRPGRTTKDMEPKKRKMTSCDRPDIPDWMKRALECPVCLEVIMDPPIYLCENPQGHSICSTYHQFLQNKEDNSCPVCRKKMLMRRSVTLENMLENIPNKVKCHFGDFKRSNGEVVRKHEEDYDNRLVHCVCYDAKIRVNRLAEHIFCMFKIGEKATFHLRS